MKYLKYFESSNYYKELNDNEYRIKLNGLTPDFDEEYYDEEYYDTDDTEYLSIKEYRENNWVPFTDKEVDEICDELEIDISEMNINDYNQMIFHNIGYQDQAYMTKLKDEWYYLAISYYDQDNVYYECDQFDGLLKTIRDFL